MNDAKALHPPLQAHKLLLLMVATLGLYQFVWLYRTAEDLRASRQPSIVPWRWALIPLLGPLMAIPGVRLATHIKRWQIDEHREVGHLAEPAAVGLLICSAYVIPWFLVFEWIAMAAIPLVSALIQSLAFVILQGQLNLNKEPSTERAYRSAPWRLERNQVRAAALGTLVALPVYFFSFSTALDGWFSEELTAGAVVESKSGNVRVHVPDDGWSRVNDRNLEEDAVLEFAGPDAETWAVVYDLQGISVDDALSARQMMIKEEYGRAECTQQKTLVEDDWTVRGTVVCTGRSPFAGRYTFESRTLRRDQNVSEIVAYTLQGDPERFEEWAGRVRRMADGLQLAP